MDIFCKIINGELSSFTCYEDEFVKCIMDANPEHPGHLLIIPKKHYTTILDMDDEIITKVHNTAKMIIKKMDERLPNLAGVKTIVNYGELQVVKHYHLHLIPIYKMGNDFDKPQEEICELLKR